MKVPHRLISLTFLLPEVAATACGDPAPGTLEMRIYGEDFIEKEIPAAAFHDGWSVKFDTFLVSLSEVTAAKAPGQPALSQPSQHVFELAKPTTPPGTPIAQAMVDGGSYKHVSYRIKPAAVGAVAGPGLNPGALDAMVAAGESLRVNGSARKGTRTVTFAWGFTSNVLHRDCLSEAKVAGGTTKAEITIHGDHLFYDDLFAKEPNVAFDLIAASDKDGDGKVTQEELAAKDISKEARYQVGSTKIANLWDFIARQVTTVGHIDGEGHCDTQLD